MYHQNKNQMIDQLPPTSAATRGQISRSFYFAFNQMNCLTGTILDPKMYGFVESEHDGSLMPSPCTRLLPEDLTLSCNCIKCATKKCACRSLEIPCCAFCKCQATSTDCKNPHVVLRVPLQTH
jgi:hypothetical protein